MKRLCGQILQTGILAASTDRYIPKHPTAGWCYSELERIGHSVRGEKHDIKSLCKLLKQHGYDVTADSPPKPQQTNDR
mgnify:CR=1 FL=1